MSNRAIVLRVFLFAVLFAILIPATLWGVVQLYELFCDWWGGCEGIKRPRNS